MKIVACKPYHAKRVDYRVFRMPDGRSVYKVYFLSIVGRDAPERYEWQHCGFTLDQFELEFRNGGYEGVGFVTAFTHITKVFRFSPLMETVMDVSEDDTRGLHRHDCSRGDGTHEFACYAEAMIAADEYAAWAKARTVEEYLPFLCPLNDFPVLSNIKMSEYWSISHT